MTEEKTGSKKKLNSGVLWKIFFLQIISWHGQQVMKEIYCPGN